MKSYYEKRNAILGVDTSGDHTPLSDLSIETLRRLIDGGFLALDEQQNDSPTTAEFMEIMEKHPGVTAHGYAIGADRPDVRVTLEGLNFNGEMTLGLAIDVGDHFHHADEFELTTKGFRVWWD